MSALSDHAIEEIRALPQRFPHVRSAVMPALDVAQEDLGHLTPDAMRKVAELLELDPGYVEGVATFYPLFHFSPLGKHHFYLCTNIACMLRGAEEIRDHIRARIGVRAAGEVSEDGLFSMEEVECLGACEYAPMMRYANRYHYDLTPEKVDALIEAARRGDPPAGPEPEAEPEPKPRNNQAAGAEPRPRQRNNRTRKNA